MMLLTFFCKASLARRLYWFLGISTLLLIVTIINTHQPNGLRVMSGLSIQKKAIRLQRAAKTDLHFESNETEARNVTEGQDVFPTVTYPDWNVSLSNTTFGIYIFLDNASLKSGNDESQWDSLNHSISSSCRSVQRLCIRILVDKREWRRSDIRQFVDRYFNTSAILCKEFGTSTEFRRVEVGDLRKSARRLTQLMASDYVAERTAYFSVIFVPNTEYRAFPDQLRRLLDMSSDEVGLVVDYARNTTLPSSLFFSKIHYEIFGWCLPPFLDNITLAVTYTFHLYPANLRTSAVPNDPISSSVKGRNGPRSSGFSPTGLSALESDRDTLRRYLSISRASDCFRCLNKSIHRIISMSLYGSSSRYTMGAIRNAQLLPITFPEWRLWFYVEHQRHEQRPYAYGRVHPTILAKLTELGAEIRYVPVVGATGLAPMLWRFSVMDDPDADVFIVRDCDSRLTPRDATVVADWLRTGKTFHCIRDHPSHSLFSVSGGLWGARREPFVAIFGVGRLRVAMRRYGSAYVQDMQFLGREVWPNVTHDAYCHDSYSCQRYNASHPFPVARIGTEHLGQVYDEFSLGRKSDTNIILRTPVNTKCVGTSKNKTDEVLET